MPKFAKVRFVHDFCGRCNPGLGIFYSRPMDIGDRIVDGFSINFLCWGYTLRRHRFHW